MKFLYIIFLAVFILTIRAEDFLKDAKRAEYFKLTDKVIPSMEFTVPDEDFIELKNSIVNSNLANGYEIPFKEFKTKNASMLFTLDGKTQEFKKVTFSLGGMSSRYYPKPSYNIKIRGNDQLYGRKQFRISSDGRDPSMIRSKLFCDIANRLNLLNSVSANYVKVTMNKEDLGFYIIMDSVKTSYVDIEYKDSNTSDLIQCKRIFSFLDYETTYNNCINQNIKNPDKTNFGALLKTLDDAKTIEELDKVFDVENFLKNLILEWLTGSWNHLSLMGHNYNLYKVPNGKWTYSTYDFESTFGNNLELGLLFRVPESINYDDPTTWYKVKFEDWVNKDQHIMKIILEDEKGKSLFLEYLQEIINSTFNPYYLNNRINEIKDIISPYVKEDRTLDSKNNLPGRLNVDSINEDFTYEQFENVLEIDNIPTQFNGLAGFSYGIKTWINDKYDFVCKNYDINCDAKYSTTDDNNLNNEPNDASRITANSFLIILLITIIINLI